MKIVKQGCSPKSLVLQFGTRWLIDEAPRAKLHNEASFFIRPESLTLFIKLYAQFMDATKTDRRCSIQHDECSMSWMSSTYAWARNWAIAFMCICKLFFPNFYFECEWRLSPSKHMLVLVANLICISRMLLLNFTFLMIDILR